MRALMFLIAAGFYAAATWIVYHGHSPQAHEGAVGMLAFGAFVAVLMADDA